MFEWRGAPERTRRSRALVASVIIHGVAVALLSLVSFPVKRVTEALPRLDRATRLTAPLRELTQPEPNKGKIAKEVNVEGLLPRERIQIPPSPPSTTRPAAPFTAPPTPEVAEAPALPEPPKLNTGAQGPQLAQSAVPPPQIQVQEKPKIAFETPGSGGSPKGVPSGSGSVPAPSSSVQEAVRSIARSGTYGGIVVGDAGAGAGGIGEALNLPPSPARQASALELLSDPRGVDFRPYLIQILSAVRRNWFAVMPESARLGRRGRVSIQFAISRDGSVPKLVIASSSGAEALDRAAVAGISASNPFPPLPGEYNGNQVRLQLTFLYSMPSN